MMCLRTKKMLHRGLVPHPIWKPMSGADAEFSAKAAGAVNAFNANGQPWQMSPLNMIGVFSKSSALKAFVMARNLASFTRWANRQWCHIKVMDRAQMSMVALMRFVLKDVVGMSKTVLGGRTNGISNSFDN